MGWSTLNKSILIDLNNAMEDTYECQYFSLRTERESRSNHGDGRTNTSSIQQDPMPDSITIRRDFDLNIPVNYSSDGDCLHIAKDKENNVGALPNITTDLNIGLENNLNLNLPASSIPSPEVCPYLAQEVHTKKRGHEGDEAYDVEPVAMNLNNEHITCSDVVDTSNIGNIVEGDIRDHRRAKSSHLDHKKPQKIHSVADILLENQEPRTKRMFGQGSTSYLPSNMSEDSQARSILPNKETIGTRDQVKIASFYDLTTDEPDQDTHDDIPVEVVELMARKNTKRSLADAENISMLLDKSTQMEKHFAGDRTHRFIRKEANVLPRKGNDTNFFYPYGGDQLGVKNLCKPQSPIQPDPSQPKNKPRSGVYFSPMNTGKFGPARTSTQHGSATALQAWGGSNMQKNILLQKHNASPRSLTLAKREVSLRFYIRHLTSSSNMNITPLQSGPVHTPQKMNLGSGMDARRKSSLSFNAQLLLRTFYARDRLNRLKIGSSKSYQNLMKFGKGEIFTPVAPSEVSKQFRWPNLERELKELARKLDVRGTQGTSGLSISNFESICELNRNPADFTVLLEENAYTINGEDLQFEERDD